MVLSSAQCAQGPGAQVELGTTGLMPLLIRTLLSMRLPRRVPWSLAELEHICSCIYSDESDISSKVIAKNKVRSACFFHGDILTQILDIRLESNNDLTSCNRIHPCNFGRDHTGQLSDLLLFSSSATKLFNSDSKACQWAC
jgi:hypothetical protein